MSVWQWSWHLVWWCDPHRCSLPPHFLGTGCRQWSLYGGFLGLEHRWVSSLVAGNNRTLDGCHFEGCSLSGGRRKLRWLDWTVGCGTEWADRDCPYQEERPGWRLVCSCMHLKNRSSKYIVIIFSWILVILGCQTVGQHPKLNKIGASSRSISGILYYLKKFFLKRFCLFFTEGENCCIFIYKKNKIVVWTGVDNR